MILHDWKVRSIPIPEENSFCWDCAGITSQHVESLGLSNPTDRSKVGFGISSTEKAKSKPLTQLKLTRHLAKPSYLLEHKCPYRSENWGWVWLCAAVLLFPLFWPACVIQFRRGCAATLALDLEIVALWLGLFYYIYIYIGVQP